MTGGREAKYEGAIDISPPAEAGFRKLNLRGLICNAIMFKFGNSRNEFSFRNDSDSKKLTRKIPKDRAFIPLAPFKGGIQ
jgi:hypothetical protein